MSISKITEELTKNKIVNDYFSRVSSTLRDDFKQHIFLQIYELYHKNPKKVELLIKENKLGQYIVGVITNQLKSKTSSFAKAHYNKYLEFQENFNQISNGEDEYEEARKDPECEVQKIIIWLQTIHPADCILFKLYYGIDPITNEIRTRMTFVEIQKLLDIPYQTVQKSCLKTKNELKKQWTK